MKKFILLFLILIMGGNLVGCGKPSADISKPKETLPPFHVHYATTNFEADDYSDLIKILKEKEVYLPYISVLPNTIFEDAVITNIETCDYYSYGVRDTEDRKWRIRVFYDEEYRKLPELYEAYLYTFQTSSGISHQKISLQSLPDGKIPIKKNSGLYSINVNNNEMLYVYFEDTMVAIYFKVDRWMIAVTGSFETITGDNAVLQDFLKPEKVPGKLAVIFEAIQAERLQAESP